MTSVADRIKAFEKAADEAKAPAAKEYFGKADVFEGSKINLRAAFKGKTPEADAEAKWHLKDSSKDSDPEPIDADLYTKTPHAITLDNVPDDKANYKYSYSLHCTLNGTERQLGGSCDFTVWPQVLKVTAKYKKGDDHATLNDGDLVEDFLFKVVQKNGEVVSNVFKTNDKGECEALLTDPSFAKLVAKSPWEIIEPAEQKDEDPRIRELGVSQKPWTAKIYSHADDEVGKSEDKPIKQVVNKPNPTAAAVSVNGPLVKLEIGPKEGLDLGLKDQKIHLRVTIPKEISKRTKPSPGLWTGTDKGSAVAPKKADGKPGEDELVFEMIGDNALKLPDDGEKVAVYIQMGLAGGTKCKVEVGVTDTLEDDVLYLESWRKVGLEVLVAKADLRQKCPDILADAGAALGDSLMTEMNRIFEGTYVEFDFPAAGCVELEQGDFKKYLKGNGAGFTWADIANPEYMFVDRAKYRYWNRKDDGTWEKKSLDDNGSKLFLLSDYQSRRVRKTKLEDAGVAKTKDTMTWIFADYLSDRNGAGNWRADMSTVNSNITTNFEGVTEVEQEQNYHVFDHDPIEANGNFGVIRSRWRVAKFRKKGSGDAWANVVAGSPGEAHRNWSAWTAMADAGAERNKWAEIVDSLTIKMKLPNTAADDPGKFLTIKRDEPNDAGDGTVEVEYETIVQSQVTVYGVSFDTLGGAVNGAGTLRTGGGRVTVLGMAQTMAHEILHNCGQTYVKEVAGQVGGWSGDAIDGVPFPSRVPDGIYYVGRDHQGSHCAKALMDVLDAEGASDADKQAVCAAGASFARPSAVHRTKYFSKIKQSDQCIMFGSGPEMATDSMDLCDTCKGYTSAADLTDVTKSW